MYNPASSPRFPLRMGRFLCGLLFLFALTSAANAQAKDTLAILPFTGAQGEDGETIAELFSFQRDLTAVFSPVPRTSIASAIRGEQGFQMESGMTDPDTIAALGKRLGATYVVAGTIAKLGNQNLLIIAILHTESLQQIAGDIQAYNTITDIEGKLPAMARNIAAAVGMDTSKLPLLALPPVQLLDGANGREADALAQILAMHLIRSGKYAVYPRTKSLEQVLEEYGNQFNGDTADEYLPDVGRANNPRLVLSVTARRLGSRNMFNAAIINLESGIQEAGDTVNYQSLNDGMKAMEDLALKLIDPEKAAAAEAARARAEQEAAAKARAEQARLAAEASAARYNFAVSDNASFTQAIIAINNDKTDNSTYTITLNGSFTSPPVTFTGNAVKTIAIKGDASVRTISNNRSGVLFTVPEGITLALDNNITLNGSNNKKNVIVWVAGGTLVMKNGSIVRGSQGGGGVIVENGAFTMSGGTISGNSTSYGGGVIVENGAFTMSGGIISENSASPDGGGVYVKSNSTFMMSGGTISGNSASYGGGVYVNSDSTFTMSGGTISGNSASPDGGGVYVLGSNSSFTMSGGTISGNSASWGGGVYIRSSTFTMSSGTISGNAAINNGGGVFVINNGTFIKNGGGTIDKTNSAKKGRVAIVDGGGRRNAAAGPSVNLDSRVSGRRGGW
ncbi:MAG: hypothetical protein LBK73_13275 [Treponema sp.]|jgi:TolB-like protein|nr:hypothetical protein [Treponema sp.]